MGLSRDIEEQLCNGVKDKGYICIRIPVVELVSEKQHDGKSIGAHKKMDIYQEYKYEDMIEEYKSIPEEESDQDEDSWLAE